MRAITHDRYGDPDVLMLTEQTGPKVGPGEVLVRVRSASVNPVDWKVAAGYLDGIMNICYQDHVAGLHSQPVEQLVSREPSQRQPSGLVPVEGRGLTRQRGQVRQALDMRTMYLPVATYGLEAITPPSAHELLRSGAVSTFRGSVAGRGSSPAGQSADRPRLDPTPSRRRTRSGRAIP